MNEILNIKGNFVYISKIPENLILEKVSPDARESEINRTSNERVKREKYFVWRLLEYAIKIVSGVNITDVALEKCESGRWVAKGFDFSLSHSDGIAAVALSDGRVGVDIEALCAPRSENFAKRILTDGEYLEFSSLAEEKKEEYLIKKWTAKEAIFKSHNENKFIPKKCEKAQNGTLKTEVIAIGDKKYAFSVFAENAKDVKIEIVNLVF